MTLREDAAEVEAAELLPNQELAVNAALCAARMDWRDPSARAMLAALPPDVRAWLRRSPGSRR
jgi:hypothetical protein